MTWLGQEAMEKARGLPPPATAHWLVWQWTAGPELPLGRLREGVQAVPALPAEGSVIELEGMSFKVIEFPGTTSPPPDWLATEIQKFKGRG